MPERTLRVVIAGDASSLQKALGRAGAQSQAFGANLSRSMRNAGASMTRVGTRMSLMITAPLTLLAKKSFDASKEFEAAMTMIETQAGAPRGEIEKLTGSVTRMAGRDVTQGPVELAKALYFVESAGYRGAKAIDILKLSAQGATVGHADFADTAKALTAAMKTGAAGTETATRAMGILNAVVGQGQMKMDDLVNALSTGALPTFKSMGMGLKDFGAALDIMTARGVPAQKAATRLNMAVLRMVPSNTKALKAFKDLGLGQFDLANAMKGPGGFPAAIDLLRDKYEQMVATVGKNKANLALQTIFPRGSVSTIMTLIGATDELGNKYDAIGKKAGEFPRAVAQAMQDSEAKTAKFRASMEAFEVVIGQILTPVIIKLADWIARAAAAFERLSPGVQKVIVTIAAIAAVAGPVLVIVGTLVSAVGALIPVFVALLSPVGLLVAAIVAVGVAIAAAVLWPDKLQAALERMGLSAKDAKQVVEALQNAFTAIKAVAMAVWPSIQAIVQGALRTLKGIFDVMIGVLTGDWSRAWNGMKEIVSGVFQALVGMITAAPRLLIAGLLALGRAIITGIENGVTAAWPGLRSWFANLPATLVRLMGNAASWLVGKGREIMAGLLAGIVSGFGAVIRWIGSMPGMITALFAGAGAWLVSVGAALIRGLVDGAMGMVGWAIGKLKGAVASIKHVLSFGWGSPPEVFATPIGVRLMQAVGDGIAKGATGAAKSASDSVGVVSDAVKTAMTRAQALAAAAPELRQATEMLGASQVRSIVAGVWGEQPSLAAQLKKALRDAMNTALQAANSAVKDARSTFAAAFDDLASQALSAFDAAQARWKPKSQKILDAMEIAEQKQQLVDAINKAAADVQAASQALAAATAGGDPAQIKAAQDQMLAAQQAYDAAVLNQRKATLQAQAAAEQEAHDKQVAQERLRLQKQLDTLQAYLSQHPEKYKQVYAKINALLAQHGVDQEFYGTAAGVAFANGLAKSEGAIVAALLRILKALERRAKLRSNADEGPLSDVESWWLGFGPALAKGLDAGAPVVAASFDAMIATMRRKSDELMGFVAPSEIADDANKGIGAPFVQGIVQAINDATPQLGDAIAAQLNTQLETTRLAYEQMIDVHRAQQMAIIKFLADTVPLYYQRGVEIANGLATGLLDMRGKVLDAALQLAKAVADAMGVALDIGKAAVGNIEAYVDQNIGQLPHYARGGVVSSPTLAWIGESGAEAVVPLGQTIGGGNVYNFEFPNYVGDRAELVELMRRGLADVARRNPGALPGVA